MIKQSLRCQDVVYNSLQNF